MDANPAETAVGNLQELGLTEYEARCFVALSRFDSATATEISEVSALPRTRVYDTAERLQDRGLVEIQDGSPRLFRAVAPERARELLRTDYERSLEQAIDDLQAIPGAQTREHHGIWTVRGEKTIDDRLHELCTRAEHELYISFMGGQAVTSEHIEWFKSATQRGAEVRFITETVDNRNRVEEVVPDVRTRPPLRDNQSPPQEFDWEDVDSPFRPSVELAESGEELGTRGWIAMADRETVMIATTEETFEAVWAEGRDNSVVIAVTQLIGIILGLVDAYGIDRITEQLST